MEREKYQKAQMEFYKENKRGLDNSITIFSIVYSIFLLFYFVLKVDFGNINILAFNLMLFFSLNGFILSQLFHLLSFRLAAKACDMRMSNDERICIKGDRRARMTRVLDTIRFYLVVISLFLIIVALWIVFG